jgi:hypothetical protein
MCHREGRANYKVALKVRLFVKIIMKMGLIKICTHFFSYVNIFKTFSYVNVWDVKWDRSLFLYEYQFFLQVSITIEDIFTIY